MTSQPVIWVVMPVYNEAAAIRGVVDEWIVALRKTAVPFGFMIINDGSTDQTASILDALPHKEVLVWHRRNVGYGPSCLFGYKTALEQKAGWVLQLDSDGQCDPAFFPEIWDARRTGSAVFGYRVSRDDGLGSWLVSRVVSLEVFLHKGCWIKDANVPYRLIRADRFAHRLELVPENASFTNILLSCLLIGEIQWVPIGFRKGAARGSAIKLGSLFRSARLLSRELLELKKRKAIRGKKAKRSMI